MQKHNTMKKMVGKQENLKYAHAEVQDQFAKLLAAILKNPTGKQQAKYSVKFLAPTLKGFDISC